MPERPAANNVLCIWTLGMWISLTIDKNQAAQRANEIIGVFWCVYSTQEKGPAPLDAGPFQGFCVKSIKK